MDHVDRVDLGVVAVEGVRGMGGKQKQHNGTKSPLCLTLNNDLPYCIYLFVKYIHLPGVSTWLLQGQHRIVIVRFISAASPHLWSSPLIFQSANRLLQNRPLGGGKLQPIHILGFKIC